MATFVGARVGTSIVPVTKRPLRLPLPLLLTWWLIRMLIRALVVIARSPVAMVALTLILLGVVAERTYGLAGVVAGYTWLTAVMLGLWRWWRPFGRFLKNRWRRFWIYRHKWGATMDFANLNRTRKDGRSYAPVLGRVRSTRTVDTVRARMLAGQVVDDWGKVSDRLCQTFGAQDCRVRSVPGKPHEVELAFLIEDPLVEVVQPEIGNGLADLAGLIVGITESGEPYRLPLLGSHVLLVGATNAGKSSVIWAIVHHLSNALASGIVQVWGVDPKAMELAAGEPLFARMAYKDPADYAELLEDAVVVMRERQVSLRGVTRLHRPTPAEPLIVIFIDELAALSYVNERDTKRRIENALGLLLSQGRAVGVTIVGAIQDPRKEVLPARDLFPVRILLRVTEPDHVALVLGPGARDRGARADKIPFSLPGVGFVQVDGVPEPVRVRFAHVTDDHIRAVVAARRPPALSLVRARDVVRTDAPEAA